MNQDRVQKPAEESKFGKGFNQYMLEIAERLGMSDEVMMELDAITRAGASSLNAATFAAWGPKKTREIFKVFVTADNETEPEIEKAWKIPYPETEAEIKAQMYLFGLMEAVYRFIKAIRPAIMGNLGVTVLKGKKEYTTPGDAFYGGKIEQHMRRKAGLERRLRFVQSTAQNHLDVAAEQQKLRTAVQLGARSAVPADKHLH